MPTKVYYVVHFMDVHRSHGSSVYAMSMPPSFALGDTIRYLKTSSICITCDDAKRGICE